LNWDTVRKAVDRTNRGASTMGEGRGRCGYELAEPTLRSLDAIHLAAAQVLTNESGTALIAFVTYDRRLIERAKAAGLPVASPGQN
ncbi:hypothetical protein V6U90_05370, partial [Micromonospora sp. CPCC 206060]